MPNIRAFEQLRAEHDRLSDKFFFLSLGQLDESIRVEHAVESGGDILEARRHLDHCVFSAQKVKARLAEIGATIGQ
jgi:hypothetical protein